MMLRAVTWMRQLLNGERRSPADARDQPDGAEDDQLWQALLDEATGAGADGSGWRTRLARAKAGMSAEESEWSAAVRRAKRRLTSV
jgi:hypothetical protein